MLNTSIKTAVFGLTVTLLSFPVIAQVDYIDQQFSVKVTSDIIYATGAVQSPSVGDKDLLLDLYQPVGAYAPVLRPGYVLVHGGNFTGGTKLNGAMVQFANQFAERGYVCVSINYRLQGDDPPTDGVTAQLRAINAAVEDAANAVRWMNANGAIYGIDTNRIALGGYSAGAITALLTGYQELGSDAEVQAVMSMAGAMYGMEGFYIDSGDPPLFMFHGDLDTTVPYSGAQDVETAVISAGLTYEFHTLTNYAHGITGPAFGTAPLFGGKTLTERHRDFMYVQLNLANLVATKSGTGHVPFSWLQTQDINWTNDFCAAAINDYDNDGVPTWKEYWFGTNPRDRDSYPQIDAVTFAGDALTLFWQGAAIDPAVPPLTIQCRTNLLEGTWSPTGVVSLANGTNTWSDPAPPQRIYYRLVNTNAPL